MFDFIIFTSSLILVHSLMSLKDFSKYSYIFYKMKFMQFVNRGNLFIANEGSKDEFVIISDWNFRTYEFNLQFDIWTLIDFHKLFWILKFNRRLKNIKIYANNHDYKRIS